MLKLSLIEYFKLRLERNGTFNVYENTGVLTFYEIASSLLAGQIVEYVDKIDLSYTAHFEKLIKTIERDYQIQTDESRDFNHSMIIPPLD